MHTMGQILENWRVVLATFFAVVLIAASFMFARGIESPALAQASAETAPLQAIAAKDSDNDGLPDWEEALYGTNPHLTDTFTLGMTDSEAVAKGLIIPKAIADISVGTSTPSTNSAVDYKAAGIKPPTEGTLTDAFAKSFFTLYVAAKKANGGNDLTSAQTSTLAAQTMNQLSSDFAPTADFKTAADLNVSGTGPDALRAFAILAETVMKKNASDAKMSDLQYFEAAVQNDDASARTHLASLAKSYRDTAVGISALAVPREAADVDLSIVNAIMHLSQIYGDFARVDTDTLSAMLALEQYRQTELTAEQSFTTLARTYAANGVVLSAGEPGALFVNVIANIGARQAKTP